MNTNFLDNYNDVLTVTDIMNILHIGKNSAYALLRSGELKSIKIGHQYRIPKLNLCEYLYKSSGLCYDNPVSKVAI